MTIREFAKIAGVSVSTVSKIMNNKDESIRAETRDSVLKLAKEYNYKIGSPALRDMPIIGVAYTDGEELCRLLPSLLSAAAERGCGVLLKSLAPSGIAPAEELRMLLGAGIDALLLETLLPGDSRVQSLLEESGIPYSVLQDDKESLPYPDYAALAYRSVELLSEEGHTDIACFLGEGRRGEPYRRGYQQCLFDRHIRPDKELIFHRSVDEAIQKIASHRFSALIVSHYEDAMRLYQRIIGLQYRIPHDVSLITLREAENGEESLPISAFHISYGEYADLLLQTLLRADKKGFVRTQIPMSLFAGCRLNHRRTIDIPHMQRKKRVISIGSVNIDHYLNVSALPESGNTVIAPESYTYPGGKGVNQAVGVAKLGHSACLIGNVGHDSDADFIYAAIEEHRVERAALRRKRGFQTGQAYIFVRPDGHSMISVMSGANNSLSREDILAQEHFFKHAGFCLLQSEIPMDTLLFAAKTAKKYGASTVLKPSAGALLSKELLTVIDIIIPNRRELSQIVPAPRTMKAKARSLLALGVPTVLVTLGADGFYLLTKDKELSVPAVAFTAIDSTGAADAFISALVSYLLYGYDMESAARIAGYAAGFCISRQGVVPSLIDRNSLESHIRQKEPGLLK